MSLARLVVGGADCGRFIVPTPGRHMVTNALAALAAVQAVTGRWLSQELQGAGRVRRRFGDHGRCAGIRLIDDYAHHPREIAAVVQTALLAQRGRLLCLFQPHRYSRTRECLSEFGHCFAGAAAVVVTGTYAAGETPQVGFGGRAIAARIADDTHAAVQYVRGPEDGAAFLLGQAQSGDTILVLGAGNVNQVIPYMREVLAAMEVGHGQRSWA